MKNLRTEKEIETRCAEFLLKMENRLVKLECDMKTKVDRAEVEVIVKANLPDKKEGEGENTESGDLEDNLK